MNKGMIKNFTSNLHNLACRHAHIFLSLDNFYKNKDPIVQQLVGQIPWGHNVLLISKTKDVDKAIWYIRQTVEFG